MVDVDTVSRTEHSDDHSKAEDFYLISWGETLGTGGSGKVYRADLKETTGQIDKRKRVVKVLAPKLPPARFLNEVEVARKLAIEGASPHIIRAERHGRDPEHGYWLAMEYGGKNLEQYRRESFGEKSGLGSSELLDIARQMCAALQFLEKEGILHLDIKPQNILRDSSGHLRLADFGSAFIVGEPGFVEAVSFDRSPQYASPEHFGGRCDKRSDLYSLGASLLHLATGEIPRRRTSKSDELHHEQIQGTPAELQAVLRKLLHSDPAKRYQEAAELLEAIDSLLGRGGSLPEFLRAPFEKSEAEEATRRWARFLRRETAHQHEMSGMRFQLLPPGTFDMGGKGNNVELEQVELEQKGVFIPANDRDRLRREWPEHTVTLTKPFGLGNTPVTRGQFRRFVSDTGYKVKERELPGYDEKGTKITGKRFTWHNPGFPEKDADSDAQPVVNISWDDITAFIEWLNFKNRDPAVKYRLPTEAEWEYACRAGTTTLFYFGDSPADLWSHANCADRTYSSLFRSYLPQHSEKPDGFIFTSPGGSFTSNAFGLFDMLGNVWEFCSDWYVANYYSSSPMQDPPGPQEGTHRVIRGGCWSSAAWEMRCSMRGVWEPDRPYCKVGFRVACDYLNYLPANF